VKPALWTIWKAAFHFNVSWQPENVGIMSVIKHVFSSFN